VHVKAAHSHADACDGGSCWMLVVVVDVVVVVVAIRMPLRPQHVCSHIAQHHQHRRERPAPHAPGDRQAAALAR